MANTRTPRDIGVIMMPHIFGFSRSFDAHVYRLRADGHEVVPIDIYHQQRFQAPFFLPKVIRNQLRNLEKLAMSFDQQKLYMKIWEEHHKLEQTCRKIVYLGYGMGGIILLKAAEESTLAY